MSKQLILSATFSVLATAAIALSMGLSDPSSGSALRGATAQGSLVGVLRRA